jgi:hypothetical protein
MSDDSDLVGEASGDVPKREPDGDCNAKRTDNGRFVAYCNQPEGWGRDADTGRCKFHAGPASSGNGRAETHGLTGDREQWFERHRDDAEDLVRALVASYVDDAPFDWGATAKVDQLCEVAIDQARLRASNDHLDEFLTEQTVSVTENGREITRLEENPAHMPRDRIKRTNAKILKDLGIMDDPDSAQASATATLAEVIDNQ